MAAFNRPLASSSTTITTSEKVRQHWKTFERHVQSAKNVMEHKISAANGKADMDNNKKDTKDRLSPTALEESKNQAANKIREAYYEKIKVEWYNKLDKAGLKAEDWTDITAEEMDVVTTSLNGGGFDTNSDEDLVVVNNPVPVPTAKVPQTYSTAHANHFFQPRPIAPSFSTSTRTSNVSSISTASTASSYAVVNPNEFHSGEEDDFYYPVTATSHDLTSDDDDGVVPPTTSTRHRGHTFGGWSSGDSLASSLHNSVESLSSLPQHPHPQTHTTSRPLVSNYIQNISHTRVIAAAAAAAAGKLPAEDENVHANGNANAEASSSTSKAKVRQPYIGPHLDDPNEPQAEADDFELFKMQTRMQKIVEFHQLAALAEIRLSIEIYKDRKSTNSSSLSSFAMNGMKREGVSSRVIEHQRRMTELQKTKEDERKTTVKDERAKRRSELRGRPGRSNTIVAPKPSAPTNPAWLTEFQETLSPALESHFDLERLLKADPEVQQESVEMYLKYALGGGGGGSDGSAPASPVHGNGNGNGNVNSYGQGYESTSASASASRAGQAQVQAPRWSTSSSAASIHSQRSRSYSHSHRSTSKSGKQKATAKASLFGEDSDDSGSEEGEAEAEEEEEEEENVPPANFLTQTASANPYARGASVAMADASFESQMQADPELAAALSMYGGGANYEGMNLTSSLNSHSHSHPHPTPSWGMGMKPTAPSASTIPSSSAQNMNHNMNMKPWGAPPTAPTTMPTKEVRATPVASGWSRKKSPPQNQNPAFANGHTSPDQFDSMTVDRLGSAMPSLAFNPNAQAQAQAQGRKFMVPMDVHSTNGHMNAQAAWEMMAEQQHPSSMMSMSMSGLGPNGNGNGNGNGHANGMMNGKGNPNANGVMNANGKGKKPMSMPMVSPPIEVEESQSIWEQMVEKQTPTTGPPSSSFFSSFNKSVPTPAIVPVPPVVSARPGKGVATPAVVPPVAVAPPAAVPVPTPAAAAAAPAPPQPMSKKMNKKQRQAAKKNTSTAASVPEPEPSPPSEAPEPVVPAEQQQQQPSSLFDDPPATAPSPPEMASSSLLSRMMPSIGRPRKDSAPPAPLGFASGGGGGGGWDDSASITTPRPASKIPMHLQNQMQQQELAGTPRPNLFKKFNTTDNVNVLNGVTPSALGRMALDQNPTGTIKPGQWGAHSAQTQAQAQSSSTASANRSIWNMFNGGPSASASAVTKASQLAAAGENGMHIPGGFDMNMNGVVDGGEGGEDDDDGGGGEEEEEELQTPQVWKASASIWGKKAEKAPAPTPPTAQAQQQTKQQPLSAAAQRQRRMSEAAAAAASSPVPSRVPAGKKPAVVAATPPQPIPTAQTGKKGARAKKNAKGKKVTMEEVPDEENDFNGGSLPVDHRALLLPANEPASPVILEPKPSMAPTMFNSIIGYGDEGEEEDAFSPQHAAGSSIITGSPPSDMFGDPRFAATLKKLQEENANLSEKFDGVSSGMNGVFAGTGAGLFGGGGGQFSGNGGGANSGVWGSAMTHGQQHDRWVPSAMSSASTGPKASAWGPIGKDKGKGKMTDVEDGKAPLPNLKRNKPAAGPGWL